MLLLFGVGARGVGSGGVSVGCAEGFLLVLALLLPCFFCLCVLVVLVGAGAMGMMARLVSGLALSVGSGVLRCTRAIFSSVRGHHLRSSRPCRALP